MGHIADGGTFGEIALVASHARRVASVYAVETSLIFRLERRDFRRVAQTYPDFVRLMSKLAEKREQMIQESSTKGIKKEVY